MDGQHPERPLSTALASWLWRLFDIAAHLAHWAVQRNAFPALAMRQGKE
jgi:hypothetical protein